MGDDLRHKLESAAGNLRDMDDEERVPRLVKIIGNIITFLCVAFFTSFGVYMGLYYASRGAVPGENGPLYTGIGLFVGLMAGTLLGVGVRKLLYRVFSR